MPVTARVIFGIPEPTEEQEAWLETWLDELGYEGEPPARHLVTGE